MNIYLIRHGERENGDSGQDTLRLTRRGVLQAELLGERLRKYRIERIYTSDMMRAIQTADIINKHLSVDILSRHDLREIDMGVFYRGWAYLNEYYHDFAEKFSKHEEDVPYPEGESGGDVLLRARPVMNEIVASSCENIAVVAHGGTIRVLICGILGLSQARRFFLGSPIVNCSISTVKYDKESGSFYVHTVNDHAHLEDMNAVC